jgi:hypothetical protein
MKIGHVCIKFQIFFSFLQPLTIVIPISKTVVLNKLVAKQTINLEIQSSDQNDQSKSK